MKTRTETRALPPGQVSRRDFPRFGLPRYASRFPRKPEDRGITLIAADDATTTLSELTDGLSRVTLQSALHCVTTWSGPELHWSGIRFKDFYTRHLQPTTRRTGGIQQIIFYAQDGYKTTLPLADCIQDNVIIADTLNGAPLTIEHGAPFRLVAPEHYGYKNLKHLTRIKLSSMENPIKRGLYNMLDHPRARVRFEERGRYLPGWMLRYVYRLFIPRTIRNFKRHMDRYHADHSAPLAGSSVRRSDNMPQR